MPEPKPIIHYQISEYGYISVKLASLLDRRGITRNRLQTLTGVKYGVIDRYYKNDRVEMADLDFLAKVCYALGCKIEDLLEYESPVEKQK